METPSFPVASASCFAGLLHLSSGDSLILGFVAAGAVAAYLRFYAHPAGPGPTGSSGLSSAGATAEARVTTSRPLPPPTELLTPSRLASLVQLLKYHPTSSGSPALEALEGAPARYGGRWE